MKRILTIAVLGITLALACLGSTRPAAAANWNTVSPPHTNVNWSS